MDKAMSNFTLLVAPVFMAWALLSRHYLVAGILVLWWLVSRGVKNLPHFSRRPINILRLPLFIPLTMIMALVKLWALITIRQQKWLTRDVAVVDGTVQRTPAEATAA